MTVAAQRSPEDAASFLGRLDCAPQGFGAASALEFARRVRTQAREQASAGPLVLFIIGEPLSGKSTFVSNLLIWLLNGQAADEPLQVRLMRWGDAMRAQRHLGLLPADRLPGDLSSDEFAGLSVFVGEQVRAARATVQAPGLIVAEFPGCTAVMSDGRLDGLDRGFSTCRAFVDDAAAHYVALTAEPSLRAMFLQTREAPPGAATEARSATPLAANRIQQQMTDLMLHLHERGRMGVAGVAPGTLPEAFERDPSRRDEVVFESFLPHLLRHEIGVPSDRALVARNGLLPAELRRIAEADPAFVDQFDYIRERYNV